jgi:hypothetical protein
VVRAKVLSLGDARSYYLTTADNALGVVHARSLAGARRGQRRACARCVVAAARLLCCAALCCAALRCAVLCCAVLCCGSDWV